MYIVNGIVAYFLLASVVGAQIEEKNIEELKCWFSRLAETIFLFSWPLIWPYFRVKISVDKYKQIAIDEWIDMNRYYRHIYIYIYIYIYISSSCRAGSTDIPEPLSPLLPIVHRPRQVLRTASRILTQLLLHGHVWGSIRVHLLWVRPCFSSSVLHVWFV